MIEKKIKNLPWRMMDTNPDVFSFTYSIFGSVRIMWEPAMGYLRFHCGWVG